jgi:intergrase/recombinase
VITKANLETKPSPAEPDFSKFADRDFAEGVEMDDSQEWIGELLAERVRQADAGEIKSIRLEEFKEYLSTLRREKGHRP